MAKQNNSSSSKKKKKSSKTRPNSISMKLKSEKSTIDKPNPFETIWSRRKFDIIGKKRKGEERRIGQARSLAIEKRKKTLLKEYHQSGKASVFVDNRIGEQDEDLPEFDKAILRSQRERQKKIKTSKYNLSDGEEDELDVNDGPWDDFNEELDRGSDDENMDGDRSDRWNQIKNLDARNPVDGDSADQREHRQKSKKEVMEEIIQKSKHYRAENTKEIEENARLVEELDKDFESLVQSQAFTSLTQPNKMNALKALVSPKFSMDLKKDELTSVPKIPNQDEPDQYDKLVNLMNMEIRARPSARTKTPEEIAEEEKERLEELEKERQQRMLANDDASDEEHNYIEGIGKPLTNMSNHISGDDLGDSFTIDEQPKIKKGWVEILEKDGEEDSEDEENSVSDDTGDNEEDSENDETKETLKNWEQSDDDVDLDSNDRDESNEEVEGVDVGTDLKIVSPERMSKKSRLSNSVKTTESTVQPSSLKQELPFTINAPESMEVLLKLFANLSNEDIVEACGRILVCNRSDRKKMQVFCGLLLQYYATLANEKPLKLRLLDLLVKPLMEISGLVPYFSAICARKRLLLIRTKFCEDLKVSDKSCWPSPKTLLLLRLWAVIYPCSDYRHPVMTPAMLLTSEFLIRCPVLSVRDAAIGSFLCSLVLLVIKQSRKLCPEALMFLNSLLLTSMESDPNSSRDSQNFLHFLEVKSSMPLLWIKENVGEIQPLDFPKIISLPEDSSFFNTDSFRASVLVSVVETLKGFVDTYGHFKAFPELFLSTSEVLLKVAPQENMPTSLQEKMRDVAERIRTRTEEHHISRQHLQMRNKKPEPIKLQNPKISDCTRGKSKDPNRERAEMKKLAKDLKKEKSGAERELRKDNIFLFETKEKERLRKEQERAEINGKNRAFLQDQEHAAKSGQLGKNRNKRKR